MKQSENWTVKGGFGMAMTLKKGDRLKVISLEGGQVTDVILFNLTDHTEKSSTSHTITSNLSLNLQTGHAIWSNERNEMLLLIEDTAGVHDLLFAACDENRYKKNYGIDDHRSCVRNFELALEEYEISRDEFPDPVNLFQKTDRLPDGRLVQVASETNPGSYVVLEAQMDLVVGISACPMDLNPIGKSGVTDVRIEKYVQG